MPQRFSQEIPWVLVSPGRRGDFYVYCEACDARSYVADPNDVRAFAYAHAKHTAGDGYIGAGDVVAVVAKPIARAFGKEPCTPCEARRRAMNQFRFPSPW